jgi:hypothetical protein
MPMNRSHRVHEQRGVSEFSLFNYFSTGVGHAVNLPPVQWRLTHFHVSNGLAIRFSNLLGDNHDPGRGDDDPELYRRGKPAHARHHAALIVPVAFSAFGTFLLRQSGISPSMDEAALTMVRATGVF